MKTPTFAQLISAAEAQVAIYPQYRGHFRTGDWAIVTIRKDIKLHGAVWFPKGSVTIAKMDESNHSKFITAWAFSNHCEASIKATDVSFSCVDQFSTTSN